MLVIKKDVKDMKFLHRANSFGKMKSSQAMGVLRNLDLATPIMGINPSKA